ncbi:MAG: peroxiredoxin [Magnetococcales bacterium]|nr:peroxiredoxin [Magnetococcales bacterium]
MSDQRLVLPELELKDQDGVGCTLRSLIGEKGLVVYFYPRDNTPGCTTEAVDFTALREEFAALGYRIVGISRDSVPSHARFRDKHDLNITLLSDPDGVACQAFGVWQEKRNYGKTSMGIVRSTFVVDSNGLVRKIYSPVQVRDHARTVLADLPR